MADQSCVDQTQRLPLTKQKRATIIAEWAQARRTLLSNGC